MSAERPFRFSPLDTTGWLYGLNGQQCLLLGGGVFLSGIFLDAQLSPLLMAAPIVAALVLSFARIGNASVLDATAIHLSYLLTRASGDRHWSASIDRPSLPFMREVEILHSDATAVGVVVNHRSGTLSATVEVSSSGFVLSDDRSQMDSISLWGEFLSAFTGNSSGIHRLTINESVHNGCHQTYVTITLYSHGLRRRRHENHREDKIQELTDHVELLRAHLENLGLRVSNPLSRQELLNAIARQLSDSRRSTARTLGQVTQLRRSPASSRLDRRFVEVDNSMHRTYWVRQWPANALPANWIEPFLMSDESNRTLTLHLEPVAPSISRRNARKTATKLETDAAQRERSGFRIDATHERTRHAAILREDEIVSGHTEFQFVALVSISACIDLTKATTDVEQAAAMAGLDLEALDGRHDLGLFYTLPIGQCPSGRRLGA